MNAVKDKPLLTDSPANWKVVSLSDLGEVNRGRSRCRPRHAPHLYGGPYPFIQTGDIKNSNGRIITHQQTYSEEGLKQSRLWPAKTMCITIAANIAETGILEFPACFPDSVVGFIADESKCDIYFVEYMFRILRRQIQQQAIGTVQDNINLETLGRVKFSIPSLEEQHRIANTLKCFDDKILLNRRMNETLEATARAIFKSWFVDFDPVRAKMEKRPYPLPAEILDLFPDSFQDSPLGEIPKGWETRSLREFVSVCKNVRKSTDAVVGAPYIGLENMPRNSIALPEWGDATNVSSHKFAFLEGQILFGKLRPYFHKVGIAPVDGVCSTDILVLESQTDEHRSFLLMVASSDEFVDYANSASTGTKMPRATWEHMGRYAVPWASDMILRSFHQKVWPMFQKIIRNIHESKCLAAARDALLPKLMSGEMIIEQQDALAQSRNNALRKVSSADKM